MGTLFVIIQLGSVLITEVNSVRPEIVDDILPDVKLRGQTAYLNCSVINMQAPAAVQWVKTKTPSGDPLMISNNEDIKVDKLVDGKRKYDVVRKIVNNREQFQLVIRQLQETDSGAYKCQIYLPNQNYQQWPSKFGNLTVQIPPKIKVNSAASIQVQEGANITLKCEADGIPAPNITWKRGDGFPLPDGGFQHRGSLYNVYNIKAVDRGQFICIADNNVKPPDYYTVQLEVRFAPLCTAVQDTVGQAPDRCFHAKLDCLVAANPRSEVIWYKTNKETQEKEQIQDNYKYTLELQDDQRLKADEEWYSLTVKFVHGSDYGDYFCTARNEYGKKEAKFRLFETMECQGPSCPSVNAGFGDLSMCLIIRISGDDTTYAIVGTHGGINKTVEEGANITLECKVYGISAPPNVTLTREDGGRLPNGDLEHRGGLYVIHSIASVDRGIYICTADNIIDPLANLTVQFIVKFAPICVKVKVVSTHNESLRATLDCLVAGYPAPEVIWYRDNKATQQRERIILIDKYALEVQDDQRQKNDEKLYSLIVNNMESSDYGDYFCTGKNQYGQSEAKIRLTEKHNMEFEVLKETNTTETLTYTIAGMILGLLVVKCLEIRF